MTESSSSLLTTALADIRQCIAQQSQALQKLTSLTADSKLTEDRVAERAVDALPAELGALVEQGAEHYAGKVRELLRLPSGELYMFHTDRLTAFDRYIGLVPLKGALLCQISRFWLEQAGTRFATHLLGSLDARTLKVRGLEPIKVEVVVRGYMAGSMQRAYAAGERQFCGVSLPEGLKDFAPLPAPIITPTTKAAVFEHDEATTSERLIEQGVCSASEWQDIRRMALELFSFGQELYARSGWILVDTKYEFGRDSSGKIYVIDEVHTPDSSRLWRASSYEQRLATGQTPEMLDKELIRRYLLEQGFSGEGEVPSVPMSLRLQLAEVYLEVAESLLVL